MTSLKNPPPLTLTPDMTPEDRQRICRGLYGHNVHRTDKLLQKPGLDINLILKDEQGIAVGGILCDTFLYSLYIDVLWVDEAHRRQGYGAQLIAEAERIAREAGCTFSHTSTFSYQAPGFYQKQGYEIFAVLDDYPDGIKQYFLKKKL